MRRTSIMLEFSDEVYDTLVEPMKKNKVFSKLLASLIEGYMNDNYIRAYADDTLADMKKAAIDSFSASIDSMSESLSSMGLFADELEVTANFGKKKFESKVESQNEVLKKEEEIKEACSHNTDLDEINKRIDSMQDSFNSVLSQLLEVVKSNNSQTVPMVQMPYYPYPNMMGYMPNMQNIPNMQNMPMMPNNPVMQGMPVQGAPTQNVSTQDVSSLNNEGSSGVINKAVEEDKVVSSNEHSSDFSVNTNSSYNENTSGSHDDSEDDDASLADDFMASMLEGNFFSV